MDKTDITTVEVLLLFAIVTAGWGWFFAPSSGEPMHGFVVSSGAALVAAVLHFGYGIVRARRGSAEVSA